MSIMLKVLFDENHCSAIIPQRYGLLYFCLYFTLLVVPSHGNLLQQKIIFIYTLKIWEAFLIEKDNITFVHFWYLLVNHNKCHCFMNFRFIFHSIFAQKSLIVFDINRQDEIVVFQLLSVTFVVDQVSKLSI